MLVYQRLALFALRMLWWDVRQLEVLSLGFSTKNCYEKRFMPWAPRTEIWYIYIYIYTYVIYIFQTNNHSSWKWWHGLFGLILAQEFCLRNFYVPGVMSADELWAQGIREYLPGVQKDQQSTAGLSAFEASVCFGQNHRIWCFVGTCGSTFLVKRLVFKLQNVFICEGLQVVTWLLDSPQKSIYV